MAKRKMNKPTDPAEIARRRQEDRRDPTKWGVSLEAMSLPANRDITHEPATRTKTARIQRYDVFALLHTREALPSASLQAVRRLQDTMARRMGTEGVIDAAGSPGAPGPRSPFTDRMRLAAEELEAIEAADGQAYWMLVNLSLPATAGSHLNTTWRAAVLYRTGEHRPRQQVEILVNACKRVADAYRDYDNAPKQRAA